jgi:hypothetical protein
MISTVYVTRVRGYHLLHENMKCSRVVSCRLTSLQLKRVKTSTISTYSLRRDSENVTVQQLVLPWAVTRSITSSAVAVKNGGLGPDAPT